MALKNRRQTSQVSDEKAQNILYVPQVILGDTATYFLPYCRAGVETVCYWFGIETKTCQVVTTLVIPELKYQTAGNYLVESESSRRIAYTMADQGLVNLAQIHTHPPDCSTRHSPYDDQHAYSTREHALSLVWPNFGCSANYTLAEVGVHERLKGKWILLSDSQVAQRIRLVDSIADYRWEIRNGKGSNDERYNF